MAAPIKLPRFLFGRPKRRYMLSDSLNMMAWAWQRLLERQAGYLLYSLVVPLAWSTWFPMTWGQGAIKALKDLADVFKYGHLQGWEAVRQGKMNITPLIMFYYYRAYAWFRDLLRDDLLEPPPVSALTSLLQHSTPGNVTLRLYALTQEARRSRVTRAGLPAKGPMNHNKGIAMGILLLSN
ncbi:hypothetical protein NDU88_004855 [Pleurodeles waltl]|uniref:Uncharacterized protein n=1 Tax=Pleurodeles waltl TaxID=8319 RepID=A0AAV7N480_PLEWA|nr:hypothetical protein NDU88_004855 [Pleurodeles waltl]